MLGTIAQSGQVLNPTKFTKGGEMIASTNRLASTFKISQGAAELAGSTTPIVSSAWFGIQTFESCEAYLKGVPNTGSGCATNSMIFAVSLGRAFSSFGGTLASKVLPQSFSPSTSKVIAGVSTWTNRADVAVDSFSAYLACTQGSTSDCTNALAAIGVSSLQLGHNPKNTSQEPEAFKKLQETASNLTAQQKSQYLTPEMQKIVSEGANQLAAADQAAKFTPKNHSDDLVKAQTEYQKIRAEIFTTDAETTQKAITNLLRAQANAKSGDAMLTFDPITIFHRLSLYGDDEIANLRLAQNEYKANQNSENRQRLELAYLESVAKYKSKNQYDTAIQIIDSMYSDVNSKKQNLEAKIKLTQEIIGNDQNSSPFPIAQLRAQAEEYLGEVRTQKLAALEKLEQSQRNVEEKYKQAITEAENRKNNSRSKYPERRYETDIAAAEETRNRGLGQVRRLARDLGITTDLVRSAVDEKTALQNRLFDFDNELDTLNRASNQIVQAEVTIAGDLILQAKTVTEAAAIKNSLSASAQEDEVLNIALDKRTNRKSGWDVLASITPEKTWRNISTNSFTALDLDENGNIKFETNSKGESNYEIIADQTVKTAESWTIAVKNIGENSTIMVKAEKIDGIWKVINSTDRSGIITKTRLEDSWLGKKIGGSTASKINEALDKIELAIGTSARGEESGNRYNQAWVILDAVLTDDHSVYKAVTGFGKTRQVIPEMASLQISVDGIMGRKRNITVLFNNEGKLREFETDFAVGRNLATRMGLTDGDVLIITKDSSPDLAAISKARVIITSQDIIYKSIFSDEVSRAISAKLDGSVAIVDEIQNFRLGNMFAAANSNGKEIDPEKITEFEKIAKAIDQNLSLEQVAKILNIDFAKVKSVDNARNQILKLNGVTMVIDETTTRVVLGDKNRPSGQTYSSEDMALALEYWGGKKISKDYQVNLASAKVSDNSDSNNYGSFFNKFSKIIGVSGTPEPVIASFKDAFGIELRNRDLEKGSDHPNLDKQSNNKNIVSVRDQESALNKISADIINNLTEQANNDKNRTAAFVIGAELATQNEGGVLDSLRARLKEKVDGSIILRRSDGLSEEISIATGKRIRIIASTSEVDAIISGKEGKNIVMVYEFGAHEGVDATTAKTNGFFQLWDSKTTSSVADQSLGRDRCKSGCSDQSIVYIGSEQGYDAILAKLKANQEFEIDRNRSETAKLIAENKAKDTLAYVKNEALKNAKTVAEIRNVLVIMNNAQNEYNKISQIDDSIHATKKADQAFLDSVNRSRAHLAKLRIDLDKVLPNSAKGYIDIILKTKLKSGESYDTNTAKVIAKSNKSDGPLTERVSFDDLVSAVWNNKDLLPKMQATKLDSRKLANNSATTNQASQAQAPPISQLRANIESEYQKTTNVNGESLGESYRAKIRDQQLEAINALENSIAGVEAKYQLAKRTAEQRYQQLQITPENIIFDPLDVYSQDIQLAEATKLRGLNALKGIALAEGLDPILVNQSLYGVKYELESRVVTYLNAELEKPTPDTQKVVDLLAETLTNKLDIRQTVTFTPEILAGLQGETSNPTEPVVNIGGHEFVRDGDQYRLSKSDQVIKLNESGQPEIFDGNMKAWIDASELVDPNRLDFNIAQLRALLNAQGTQGVEEIISNLKNDLSTSDEPIDVWQQYVPGRLTNFIAMSQGGVPTNNMSLTNRLKPFLSGLARLAANPDTPKLMNQMQNLLITPQLAFYLVPQILKGTIAVTGNLWSKNYEKWLPYKLTTGLANVTVIANMPYVGEFLNQQLRIDFFSPDWTTTTLIVAPRVITGTFKIATSAFVWGANHTYRRSNPIPYDNRIQRFADSLYSFVTDYRWKPKPVSTTVSNSAIPVPQVGQEVEVSRKKYTVLTNDPVLGNLETNDVQ
ncbi:hypothetical protein HZB69_04055, partial [Candidatus Amesbacteria bacterium]|nr:hypothetical protein [Candidatus Amesbacteria bacterium]